jgi:acetyl esterase/lipase
VDFQGNPQTLLLDIYEPAGDTAHMRPVVIFMHGGVFVTGDKDQIFGVGEWLASRGYVVVSNQYRLRPNLSGEIDADLIDAIIDAYDDSLAAVNWVRDHAGEHRLDPRAIVASGVSAGAVNAWNLAYFQQSPARPEPSNIAAAVSISGATIGTPSPGDPPVIAFHGTADNIVPFALAEASCTSAVAIGLRCELVAYEGGDHFVGLEQTEDIQRRTLDFLAEEVLLPLGYFGELEPAPAGPVVREPALTG